MYFVITTCINILMKKKFSWEILTLLMSHLSAMNTRNQHIVFLKNRCFLTDQKSKTVKPIFFHPFTVDGARWTKSQWYSSAHWSREERILYLIHTFYFMSLIKPMQLVTCETRLMLKYLIDFSQSNAINFAIENSQKY